MTQGLSLERRASVFGSHRKRPRPLRNKSDHDFLFRITARDKIPPREVVTARLMGDPVPGRRVPEIETYDPHRADLCLRKF